MPNRLSKEQILNRFRSAHRDKYDYSLFDVFESVKTKIPIICKTHGIFNQRIWDHINYQECPLCMNKEKGKHKIKTHEYFINQMEEKYGDEFECLEQYERNLKKILFLHKICGTSFKKSPKEFLREWACPHCLESIGTRTIKLFLIDNNINFKKEHYFQDCRNPLTNCMLRFDFAIFDKNDQVSYLIEYDGPQHFKPNKFFSKNVSDEQSKLLFNSQIFRDNIKNEYCKTKNIKLIRIPYWRMKDIEKLLSIITTPA